MPAIEHPKPRPHRKVSLQDTKRFKLQNGKTHYTMDTGSQRDISLEPSRGRRGTTRQRPKVREEDRKRTALACDHCRTRKIKCTGKQPCRQCQLSNVECRFPPSSAKIVLPQHVVEGLERTVKALEECLIEAVPNPVVREEVTRKRGITIHSDASRPPGSPVAYMGAGSPATSLEEGEEFGEADYFGPGDGYASYLGDSAGGTFLDQIGEFIRNTLPLMPALSSEFQAQASGFGHSAATQMDTLRYFSTVAQPYHSYDRLPLPLPATDPYTLPQKAAVLKLVEGFLRYCGSGTASHGVTGGGIWHWFSPGNFLGDLDLLYESVGYTGSTNGEVNPMDYAALCSTNLVLAIGCQATASTIGWPAEDELEGFSPSWRPSSVVPSSTPTSQSPNQQPYVPQRPREVPGMTFFARAKLLLVNPVEEATRPCLRSLALMAFFLLSAYRRDAGYMYIGLAVRMAVAHGLHRSDRKVLPTAGSQAGSSRSAAEDTELAQARIEKEERAREFWNVYILDRLYSCVTGRPVMLSDDDIDVDLPAEAADGPLPSGVGLAAHVRLAKIMGEVSKIYRVWKPGTTQRRSFDVVQTTEKIHAELEGWKDALHPELKLVNGVARGRSVLLLHLLCNQLYILTTRPSVLLAAKNKTAAFCLSFSDVRLPQTIDEHVGICAFASRRNIALMKQLNRSGWVSGHSFTDYHYLFNAVLVLLLIRLIEPYPDPANQNDEDDLAFGISFLIQLGEKGNQSAATSANICVELRDIVQRILLARQQALAVATTAATAPDIPMAGAYDYHGQVLNDPYGVMGGVSTTVGNDVMHQWLQSGPYSSGP